MRSNPTKGGHANQCIYGDDGTLTTYYPAAGSVDFKSSNLKDSDHMGHDVDTFVSARWGFGNVNDYYKVRPVWAEWYW